jgi:excisionase family DNA binding protein
VTADDILDDAPTDLWIRPTPVEEPLPRRLLSMTGTVTSNGDVLSADEVAKILRVDRKTVYEFASRGEIPCRRLGRRILFYRPALMAWLNHARPRRAGEEDVSDAGTS